MFRRLVSLAVLVLATLGCSKKNDSGGDSETASGPAYTIKLCDERQGEKVAVVEIKKKTFTSIASGPKGKKNESKTDIERYEYTETVADMPAGAGRATSVTRAYKVAEKSENGGPPKSLSYAGKTLVIEKKGGSYTFTANGKNLPADEARGFRDTYESRGRDEKVKNEDMLPKKAVQVHEKWTIEPDVMRKFATDFAFPIDLDKSKGTGRLTKAYTKDDHQWGVIEVKLDLAIVEKGTNGLSGYLTATMTFDTAIDGSSADGVVKMKMTGRLSGKPGPGVDLEITVDFDDTKTRTTVE